MDLIVAMLVSGALFLGALVTGQLEPLCKDMGGTYTPAPPPTETCPGGKWSELKK